MRLLAHQPGTVIINMDIITETKWHLTPLTALTVHSTIPSKSDEKGLPALIFLHFWGGSSRTFSKLVAHP